MTASRVTTWRNWISVLALILLLVAVAFGAWLIRATPRSFAEDFRTLTSAAGPFDAPGFYIREEYDGEGFRWTSAYGFLELPHAFHQAPSFLAALRLRSENPDGPQPLTFLSNETPLVTVTPSTQYRTYRFLIPPSDDLQANLRLALQTTPFFPPQHPRPLGVMVSGAELISLPHNDWGFLLLNIVIVLAAWGILRWRMPRGNLALAGTALIGASLLGVMLLSQPAPLSYPLLAALAGMGIVAALLIGRSFLSRIGLSLLAILVSFSGAIWPSWITDDSFISFRYAQNLVAGHGLVYNVGERVEGYTNFLWTMLAALVLQFGGDLVFWSYVSGGVIALVLFLLVYWLGAQLLSNEWALAAALLSASSQSVLVYTARGAGLETGLFALLGILGAACYFTPQWRNWSAIVFALATLTRPEGALFMALTLGFDGLITLFPATETETRRHLPNLEDLRRAIGRVLPLLGLYLLIVVPYFLWRMSYYGEWLPNTFYAKTGGGVRQVLRGLSYAGAFALAFGGPLLLLALVPLLTQGWQVLRSWTGYLLLVIGVYSLYIISVGGDHFPGERFFVPLVPWLALVIAGGCASLEAAAHERIKTAMRRVRLGTIRVTLVTLLLAFSSYALVRSVTFDTIIRGDDESVWIWREIGWWVGDHAAPDDTIAALGAGAVAYYSDHTTIDLLGLTEKHIARVSPNTMGSGTAGHEKRDPAYVLNQRQPTYIPRIWDEYFGGAAGLADRYELITVTSRYGRTLELWKRKP